MIRFFKWLWLECNEVGEVGKHDPKENMFGKLQPKLDVRNKVV